MPKTYAHCDRNGVISFSEKKDEDGLICLGGGRTMFRDNVIVHARHSKTSDTLLVPGVPEAANVDDALEATRLFSDRLAGMSASALEIKYDIKGMQQRALDAIEGA